MPTLPLRPRRSLRNKRVSSSDSLNEDTKRAKTESYEKNSISSLESYGNDSVSSSGSDDVKKSLVLRLKVPKLSALAGNPIGAFDQDESIDSAFSSEQGTQGSSPVSSSSSLGNSPQSTISVNHVAGSRQSTLVPTNARSPRAILIPTTRLRRSQATSTPTGSRNTSGTLVPAGSRNTQGTSIPAGPTVLPWGEPPIPAGPTVLPWGEPPAWADERSQLCETLGYYRAYQGAVYTHDGYCHGMLIDFPNGDGQYMDEEIIITKAPGSCEMLDDDSRGRVRQQVRSQTYQSAHIKTFENNMNDHVAIGVIFGSKHALGLATMPHRFNVGAFFHITHIWAQLNGLHTVFMFRLQKVNLNEKSWWAPLGSALPPANRDYLKKAPLASCIECQSESPLIYDEGWVCVNHACGAMGRLQGHNSSIPLSFNQDWLNERKRWPTGRMPEQQLAPTFPENINGTTFTTSVAGWKGFICPRCHCCNSRIDWAHQKCIAEGCDYSQKVTHAIQTHLSLLPPHVEEVHGHAIPHNVHRGHVECTKLFLGHWVLLTYKLCENNYVTHFMANRHINGRPGGANDMLLEMQKGDGLGLKRPYMRVSRAQGQQLTRHYARNFGMPYNYVAAPDSAPFSEAPPAIMTSLNRLTWAGSEAVRGQYYPPRNELLAVGYMESQRMGYHDDGERELDDLVSTWSLGAPAHMEFRIKRSHAHPNLGEESYDPTDEVVMGSDFWQSRQRLNALYRAGHMNAFRLAKREFFDTNRTEIRRLGARNAQVPWCLQLQLSHGDFVVMHGAQIHTSYEHQVIAGGALRYAMTARYVRPHLVDPSERWRGDFTLAPGTQYTGDLDLPIPL